ncbi:high mobility group box domain-containing protein [Blakeslea trispora]|nr:high mobility group box domain-containing protein [Blakeslea trispora]
MNNLSGNIEYSLQQYAAITQAHLLGTSPLRHHSSPQEQQTTLQQHRSEPQPSSQPPQGLPMQDPNAFNLAYQPFPLVRMMPPQLHQPTLAKELSNTQINSMDQTQKQPQQTNATESASSEAPTRVTRPPNAYLLFNKEMRRILKNQDPSMKVADISKEVGFRWKNMSKEQKEHYIIQANKLKEEQKALHPNAMYMRRSRAELVEAGKITKRSTKDKSGSLDSPSEQSPTRKKRPKRNKNSSTPKHPLSAYMWYLTEVRPETMRNFPGSNVGQISKLCADRWNSMTEEARLPWKKRAQLDKERYAREMQIYAIQNDHALGRGTRQKYRAAALKQVNDSFMDPLLYKTLQQPQSQQPQQILINTQPMPSSSTPTPSSSSAPIHLPMTTHRTLNDNNLLSTPSSETDSFLMDHPC